MSKQENTQDIYRSNRDFVNTSMKQVRSSIRRMIRRDNSTVEFNFADSELESARKFNVRIELNKDVTSDDTANTKEFLLKRCDKIQYKNSDMSRFTQCENVYELYSKIQAYYKLAQR